MVKGSLIKTVQIMPSLIHSYDSVILLIVNILVAYLLTGIVMRNLEKIKWLKSFMAAITINIIMIWTELALFIQSEPKHNIVKGIYFIYDTVFFHVFYDIPSRIIDILVDKIPHVIPKNPGTFSPDPFRDLLQDVLFRGWFVIVTFAFAWIMFMVKRKWKGDEDISA